MRIPLHGFKQKRRARTRHLRRRTSPASQRPRPEDRRRKVLYQKFIGLWDAILKSSATQSFHNHNPCAAKKRWRVQITHVLLGGDLRTLPESARFCHPLQPGDGCPWAHPPTSKTNLRHHSPPRAQTMIAKRRFCVSCRRPSKKIKLAQTRIEASRTTHSSPLGQPKTASSSSIRRKLAR